jgi:hypothetical protein
MDAEIITQKNGLFPLQGRPKRPVSSGPPASSRRAPSGMALRDRQTGW